MELQQSKRNQCNVSYVCKIAKLLDLYKVDNCICFRKTLQFNYRRFVSGGGDKGINLFDELVSEVKASMDHRSALGGNAPVSFYILNWQDLELCILFI